MTEPSGHDARGPRSPVTHDVPLSPASASQASGATARRWQPPRDAASAWPMVPLRLTGLAIMLALESVAAVLAALFLAALAQAALSGSAYPLDHVVGACVIAASAMLRAAALVLVRLGRSRARWAHVGAAAIGMLGGIVPGLLLPAGALTVVALVTISVLFGRTTSMWLRWRAQHPPDRS